MTLVKSIGILGAGQMGRGIAQVASMSGHDVLLYDAFPTSLEKGFSFI
jgi:3-hydroxybutyryl-CoA dehydrogenase